MRRKVPMAESPILRHGVRTHHGHAKGCPLYDGSPGRGADDPCLKLALTHRAGRTGAHVRERCNIPRSEVLTNTREIDPTLLWLLALQHQIRRSCQEDRHLISLRWPV